MPENEFLPLEGVPRSPFTGVPGWDTIAEEERLMDLAAKVPLYGTIVELGAEYGRSAAAFSKTADPSVRIYSIDLFPEDHPAVGRLVDAHKHNLTQAGFRGRTIIIKLDSTRAGQLWQFGKIDLLFIDAEHSYAAVMRDLKTWGEHIKIGGIIACHDCAYGDNPHKSHIDIDRAVTEWLETASGWKEGNRTESMRILMREA